MVEEEKFECVFGYGDCPVRAMMAKEQREAEAIRKSVPLTPDFGKDVPPKAAAEMKVFLTAMMTPIREMIQGLGSLRDVALFCAACPKARAKEEPKQ